MLKELSNECAVLATNAARNLVHIGGHGIEGRTGILRGPGLIVSLAKEARDGEPVDVIGNDRKPRTARVKAFDARSGMVILETDQPWEGIAPFDIAPPPAMGSLVLTVAFPSPQGPEVILGTVRFSGGETRWNSLPVRSHFQTGNPAFLGFSGSAVLDAEGDLAGVVVENEEGNAAWILGAAEWSQMADALVRDGSWKPYRLGISLLPVSLGQGQREIAGQGEALLISAVQSGSPAAAAGVMVADLLLSMDGKPVESKGGCCNDVNLGDRLSGDEVVLGFLSGGKKIERRIKPARAEG